MEPGNPERRENQLPPETQQAMEFINIVFSSFETDWTVTAQRLPPDTFNQWKYDNQSACMAFMLGIKPATIVDKLKDIEAIQKYLDKSGKNAFIYQDTMIVDRDLVLQRIKEETDFAQALGWQEGLSVDEWLTQANPGGDGKQRGIIGFFLGYPKSAIMAYSSKQIKKPYNVGIPGLNVGRTFYFTTDAELSEADDIKALAEKTKMTFEKAGLGKFMREKVDV